MKTTYSALLLWAALSRRPLTHSRVFLLTLIVLLPTLAMGQATIEFQNQTSVRNNDANAIQIPAPANLQDGSFLVAQITFEKGSDLAITALPAGWTLANRQNSLTDLGQAVYWKFITSPGSEPTSYRWSFSQSVKALGGILHYTGVDSSDPFIAASGARGDNATLVAPSVHAEAGSVLLGFYGIKETATLTNPAGMTLRSTVQDLSNAYTMIAVDESIAGTGMTGQRTSIASKSSKWVAQLISMRPRAALPPELGETVVDANPGTLVADGESQATITVQLRDSLGNPASQAGVTIVLQSTLGELADSSGQTDDEGQYLTSLTASTSAGLAVISGTAGGEAFADTAEVVFLAGEAVLTQTTVSADHGNLVADGQSQAAVMVQLRDAFGNPASQAGVTIVLQSTLGELADSSGQTDAGGQYFTSLTASTSAGLAVVSGTAGGEAFADTAEVAFLAGEATRLSFDLQPSSTTGGAVFAVSVRIEDINGNLVDSAQDDISLSMSAANGASLSGDTIRSAIAGIAEFTNLRVDLVGIYSLTATSAELSQEQSNQFEITVGEPEAIVFGIHPVDSTVNHPLIRPVTVHVVDPGGNVLPLATHSIEVRISSGPMGAELTGEVIESAAEGVAVFTNLVLDTLGSYSLVASTDGLENVISTEFEIRADRVFSDRFEAIE